MAKKPTVNDPVLGTLKEETDGLWEGQLKVKGFKDPLRLYITTDEDAEEGELLSKKRRAYLEKLLKDPQLRAKIQSWLLEYYEKAVEKYIRPQMRPKSAALEAPVLQRPEQVWDLVSHVTLAAPAGDGESDITISGNATWDEEHGFEFHIKGDKFVAT